MTAQPSATASLPSPAELEHWVQRALTLAKSAGASAAEVSLSHNRGLSVSVRKGEVESIEFQRDRDLGVTVFFGQRTGNAGTTDLSEAGLKETVAAACAIAQAGGEDPCVGLADPELLARAEDLVDLDLRHPWALTPDHAIALARDCEAAAFAADPRILQSEGASADSRETISVYGNSNGFIGTRWTTDHSLGCAVIAVDGDTMQVGHWYSSARHPDDLQAVAEVGRRAGERAAARLGTHDIPSGSLPILFPAETARGLFSHLAGAISGSALYRRASFLLNQLGEPIFADRINIHQRPHLRRAAASSCFDQEGVATRDRTLVANGLLNGYLLGSYSARKLGMATTGNAGGIFNLIVDSTFDGGLQELIRDMGEGLVITDLMGQGANLVTGDYSRGAAGFYVKNGEIQFPVEEITIAGRLQDMFRGIQAIGTDIDTRGGIRCGSVLIDAMTVAA